MKRPIEYTPVQYKTFGRFKEVLQSHAVEMVVMVGQPENYCLAFPNKEKYGDKAGAMFAAIQDMQITVDLYLSALIDKKDDLSGGILKGIGGY